MNPLKQEAIIEIKDLNVIYNGGKANEMKALENANVEIFPKEYVIIFGPSGCGKSTLLYSIAGLQKPTSGMIKVQGQDISQLRKKQMAEFHCRAIGLVFQAFHLIPSISILGNTCLPRLFSGDDAPTREAAAATLLERFNIANQANKFPAELSGGQKQRVAIARALINDPQIILADEPVGNLDSKSAFNVMSILEELNKKDGKTVILVTHDPAYLKYGNKVIHMKDGKIINVEVTHQESVAAARDSYIFDKDGLKQGLAEKGLIKESFLPADLKQLMKSFKSLSPSQIGSLLVPFKVHQLFSYLFYSITEEQVEVAKKKLNEVLFSRINFDQFEKDLDKDLEKGGAGWDSRVAKAFSQKVLDLMEQSNKIDFSNPQTSAGELSEYLIKKFSLKMSEEIKKKFQGLIIDRFKNTIGLLELKKIMDLPTSKDGLGLNKRKAEKIAREIELLLLLRY